MIGLATGWCQAIEGDGPGQRAGGAGNGEPRLGLSMVAGSGRPAILFYGVTTRLKPRPFKAHVSL